ncbi:MAG: DUF4432 family protein [Chloroflexota bacterium]
MTTNTRFFLSHGIFNEAEKILLEFGNIKVSAFRYESGVEALRLTNECGEIIVLPFQGQQIWSAKFYGRNLTMKSMFPEPKVTQFFTANYGAFFIHCGATAMGNPTPEDKHPLHGELPNAFYQQAYLITGEDEKGKYVGVSGKYQHTIAFAHNYVAEPQVKFYEASSLLTISMSITNLKQSEMDLMYLAHINFRPVDQGRLVYSALPTPEHVWVRPYAPGMVVSPGYQKLIEDLAQHPEKHHIMKPENRFDPEAVFFIDYLADEEGWAHTLQVLPDGSADYVRYQPAQLKKVLRWISRTGDQDALGMALPATAESEGYLKEKTKGNVQVLEAGGRFFCEFETGFLNAADAEKVEKKVERILASAKA